MPLGYGGSPKRLLSIEATSSATRITCPKCVCVNKRVLPPTIGRLLIIPSQQTCCVKTCSSGTVSVAACAVGSTAGIASATERELSVSWEPSGAKPTHWSAPLEQYTLTVSAGELF